jgi:hypothetical protein
MRIGGPFEGLRGCVPCILVSEAASSRRGGGGRSQGAVRLMGFVEATNAVAVGEGPGMSLGWTEHGEVVAAALRRRPEAFRGAQAVCTTGKVIITIASPSARASDILPAPP